MVDRFFPSSKKCCKCGRIKKELRLFERVYHCECGNKMDRDHNAAINIREEARSLRLKIRDLSGGSMSRKYKENANENNYKPQVPDVMEAIFDVVYLVFDLIAAILFLYFQKEICYLFFMEY